MCVVSRQIVTLRLRRTRSEGTRTVGGERKRRTELCTNIIEYENQCLNYKLTLSDDVLRDKETFRRANQFPYDVE